VSTRPTSRRRRSPPKDFEFQNLNLSQVWSRLALTATQLSQLTGVSRRQVEWWRRRGYLPPSPEAPDRFNGDAVTLAMLIKQAVDSGVPLARAYELATRHLARQLAEGVDQATAAAPGESSDPSALLDIEQKLLATRNTIGLVLDVVAPLSKRVQRELQLDEGPLEVREGRDSPASEQCL
jgi:DNA-binding transcriptional MerR regulator